MGRCPFALFQMIEGILHLVNLGEIYSRHYHNNDRNLKVWILETFTAHMVIGHTAKRMNLILTQIVPNYQYECLLRFDK